MRKSLTFLVVFCALLNYTHVAQAQEPISTKRYNEAYKMAEVAKSELIAGRLRTADSLVRRSISIYTTLPVFDYAIALGSLPDINGANLIMDLAAENVRTSPGYKDDPMATLAFIKKKNMQKVGTVPYDRERKLYNVYQQIQKVNFILGERKWIIRSMQKMSEPVIKSYGAESKFIDIEIEGQQIAKARLAGYLGHFDEALKVVEDMPLSDFFTAKVKEQAIKNINLDNYYNNPSADNNSKARAMLKDVPGNDYAYFAFLVSIGENLEARQVYNKLSESRKTNVAMQYYLALMDITDGNYNDAINKLQKVVKGYATLGQETDFNLIVNKFMLYKAWGDAYNGLKQFDKARDNYKLALLYNSEYKPAKAALTKLDIKIAEASAVDKTPPVFTISEPIFDRNFKVTLNANTVMIKGQANDISGIREVTINGKKVYAQKSGDFWGEVPLVSGVNNVKISVVDMSSNQSFKNYVITRQNAAVPNTAIVPVEKGRPRNYCLLIAAQNYTDTSIPSLDHPIGDAIKLKLVLKTLYDFPDENIFTLFNPQTSDLRRQLLELNNTIQPDDNLVIFYAGHGIWVEKEKKGYWLMTDADYRNSNTWLPNKEVLDMIAKLPARHTLLITDACFSGSVFKSRGLTPGVPTAIKEMGNTITRVAITSGNDTEVPDESIFMRYLIKALSNNKDKYLTAQKMFVNDIIEAVMNETKTEPRYGTLESAGHIGGDFIFVHNN